MNWNNCISSKRQGRQSVSNDRSHYQRDFDRIIFSSSFRRLQGKTQVFPLPGNTFVHNRLTHSLEVSSVGRSIGSIVGDYIASTEKKLTQLSKDFYQTQLSSVVASACLAHDLGNPPFGHSGEDAISNYFNQNSDKSIGDRSLKEYFDDHEWSDISHFEGNANALHIATKHYHGKSIEGMGLTYVTLASILKYPCSSIDSDKSFTHRKKYGYFKSDKNTFKAICESTSLHPDFTSSHSSFKRHPFVYLVEAADDICYRIIDIEDAHRINIISSDEIESLFVDILNDIAPKELKKVKSRLNTLEDENERIAYLRSKIIGFLIRLCANEFIENKDLIIQGNYLNSLYDVIEQKSQSLKKAKSLSIEKIYNNLSVVQLEITGYRVIYELLDTFIPAILKSTLSPIEKKFLQLVPAQYKASDGNAYQKVLNITDFIAGMTDGYATELYRKCNGIIIDNHRS